MRSFALAAWALASAALSQAATIQGLPECTSDCITSSFGGCGQLNVQCICANTPFVQGLACCISVACSPSDQQKVIQFANQLCNGQGVTDLPTTATCTAGQTPSFVTGVPATTYGPVSGNPGSSSGSSTGSSSGSSSSGTAGTTGSSGSSSSTTTGSGSSSAASASATHNAGNRAEGAALAILLGAVAVL